MTSIVSRDQGTPAMQDVAAAIAVYRRAIEEKVGSAFALA
jgi:ornithine cyclodeaminase/alanine dehydrogenase-like protein (mu-crystallin family)